MKKKANWLWLAAPLALFGLACSPAQPPVEVDVTALAAPDDQPETQMPNAEVGVETEMIEEIWMVCRSGDSKVGYTYTRVEPIDHGNERQMRYSYEDRLTMKRFRDTTVVQTKLNSLETIDGRIIEFRTEMKTGPEAIVTEGRYADGELTLQTTTAGKQQKQAIPWNPDWGGFFADQRSLRKKPMKPRETRSLKALLPILNQVGEIRMKAAGYEAVSLSAGSRQLLRIDVEHDLGAARLKTMLWTDEDGKVWKMRDQQLGLEFHRTTKEVALGGDDATGLDLGSDIVVKVDRPLQSPHRTRRIVYGARLKDGEIASLFATGASQSVKAIDERTAELTVRAIRPDEPKEVNTAEEDQPKETDSVSSAMIQSDDARVVAMANAVAADETNPWEIAQALERHVKSKIHMKNYTTAMATAAEVAKSLEGDCTEHAMLLAALCRARKIPARVAIGLVYFSANQGFAYHMWTEAWIKDRWIPIDATLGQGGIGAAHIKFSHSSMHGANALGELLPVIQAIGRLDLEVVAVE